MKIKYPARDEIIDVFGVYCIGELYFYGLEKGYGLLAYKARDVEIVDPDFSINLTFFSHGIYHKDLINKNLLDDLVEGDPIAYKLFIDILKKEGAIDPDSY
jgi:hypothetical protein